MRIAIFAFVLMQSMDILTTYVGLRSGLAEANPTMAVVQMLHGEMAMYLFKGVMAFGAILLGIKAYQMKRSSLAMWIGVALTSVAVVSNISLM